MPTLDSSRNPSRTPVIDRSGEVRTRLEEWKNAGSFTLWVRSFVEGAPGWTTSLIVHAVLLILLALITIIPELDQAIPSLIATTDSEQPIDDPTPLTEFTPNITAPVDPTELTRAVEPVVEPSEPEPTNPLDPSESAPQFGAIETETGLEKILRNPNAKVGVSTSKGDFTHRKGPGKAQILRERGGSDVTEAAVGRALQWLALHQTTSGAWDFNHGRDNRHLGPVNDPGSETSVTAATALGLLPFLGAGQTHKEGKYQEVVYRGLYALLREGKPAPEGIDFRGSGSMYAHGLAAIALCEAYAMTKDSALRPAAQGSIDFIVAAQDRSGGGWRYTPGQPGDTSVVGWQLMALKSGHLAYLKVPEKSIAGVVHFLDSVQANNGANYGYTTSGVGPATSSVGLLCRMYLGWKRDRPALEAGVRYLSAQGPQRTNIYFNYYAAQVLMHHDGEAWRKWNPVMREQLTSSQVQKGTASAELGSWYTPGQQHGERGGRLYETSLSTMTLEVYYRNMPIYGKQAAEGNEVE